MYTFSFIHSFIHSRGCLLIHHTVYEFSYLSICLCFAGIEANVVMQKQKMAIGALLRDMAIIDPDPFTMHKKVSPSYWARMQEEHISCTYVLCIIPCVILLGLYAGGAYILYLCIIPCVILLGPYAGGAYILYLCIMYYTVC